MRIFLTIGIFCLLSLSVFAENITGKIVNVADGDTVTLLTANNKQIRIRLNCIDAPEKSQAFGKKSKESLINLVAGKYVTVQKHDVDRYGRVVGTIYLDNTDVNLLQVKNGLAWVYDRYCNDRTYYDAESRAREAKIGLWRQSNPIEPWNYRRGERKETTENFSGGGGFECGKKKYCSQMTSCEEVMFYFRECGLTRLDGNNDCEPCESICR